MSNRRWGQWNQRMGYSTLSSHTQMICGCGKRLVVLNARPFWDESPAVTMCPECQREHRTRFVVESRGAPEREAAG